MATFKCKMCGGSLTIEAGATVCECDYCGSKQTLPSADNEKKLKLFDRANRLRFNCEFDKAGSIYEDIINEFPEEAEAYWGNLLCKYGIEYVDDPATGDKVPTCHRSSFDSFMDEEDFELVMENSDMLARNVYREQAKQIEEIRKGIIEVSGKEQPYDIFICYKETDENNQRTLDSVLAQDVYDALTEKGYRTFFSRISLEDKLGTEYEPYIFAALNSAKIMLAFGTSYDYYNAVWVKNEWSRYLKLMAKDKSKHLIPCFKGIDAYDMPKEFAKLQAQDLGKVGATQDLLRGIDKLIGGSKQPQQTASSTAQNVIVQTAASNVAPLLDRAFMALEDGEWKKADDFCEQVLNQDARNAQAYLGILMSELQVKNQNGLKDCKKPFDDRANCEKLLRFGNDDLKKFINDSLKFIRDRNENDRLTEIYNKAKQLMESAKDENTCNEAVKLFQSIAQFRDARELTEKCKKLAEHFKNLAEEKKIEFDNTVNVVLATLQAEKDRKDFAEKSKSLEEQLENHRYCLSNLESFLDTFTEICEKIKSGELQLRQMEKDRKQLEAKYSSLGIFAGKEKRSITEQIDSLNSNIYSMKDTIKELEGKKRGYTSLDAIRSDIAKAKSTVADIQNELALNEKHKNSGKVLSLKEALKLIYQDSEMIQMLRSRNETLADEFVLHVGSRLNMGRYAYNSISWRVLSIEYGKALLISCEGLNAKPFNENDSDISWEDCTLRTWLNNDFYKAAFSNDEQKIIVRTKVAADKNPEYCTPPGNATEDNIFLLSIAEAEKYFTNDDARKCSPTAYATWTIDSNITAGGAATCCWWLRSPGGNQHSAACVGNDGSVSYSGYDVDGASVCVRPAMWINLDS